MDTKIILLIIIFATAIALGSILWWIKSRDKSLELVVIQGALMNHRLKLRKREVMIGSDPKCDIVLNEPSVSSKHASIVQENGRLVVLDQDSQTGIWASGRRIISAALQVGSQFQIGTTIFALLAKDQSPPKPIDHISRRSTPTAALPTAAPKQVFELGQKVGAGGQVTVYRGRLKQDNTIVAVKCLNHAPQDDSRHQFFQRFKRQILIGTSIRHPYCVRIIGGDPTSNPPYLIEEFIEGETLRDFMARGRLSSEEALRILGQICDALYYLHTRKKLVHRDIKPSNILLDRQRTVKVTDFGLVRLVGEPRITQIGITLGTPQYMSAEQARGDSARITFRSDLYSLGVVAYEMFTGKLPFDGATESILNQHLRGRPRPPIELDQRLPESINHAILCALEKDPAKRFRDAKEMAQAFGYKAAFNEGTNEESNPSSAQLKLQNTSSGNVIPIKNTPTVLTRKLISPNDSLISREHGRIFLQDSLWRIAELPDKPSSYGIFVNGVRVDDEGDVLQDGDEIRVGNTVLRVASN